MTPEFDVLMQKIRFLPFEWLNEVERFVDALAARASIAGVEPMVIMPVMASTLELAQYPVSREDRIQEEVEAAREARQVRRADDEIDGPRAGLL